MSVTISKFVFPCKNPTGLSKAAHEIERITMEAKNQLPRQGSTQIQEIFERLHSAAKALGRIREGNLKAARKHFASLSREVIAYLRDFAPDRVARGELRVFRCPMANDQNHQYGYDLWVQKEPDIANPYMGQLMPRCGAPASLR